MKIHYDIAVSQILASHLLLPGDGAKKEVATLENVPPSSIWTQYVIYWALNIHIGFLKVQKIRLDFQILHFSNIEKQMLTACIKSINKTGRPSNLP